MGDAANGKESKGKGKQAAEPEEASQHDPQDALVSRIAKSAISLPSALLSGAPQPNGLAAAVGGGEKAGSSRTAESLSRVGESYTQARPNLANHQTLKSGPVQEHVAKEEAAFSAFLDSTSPQVLLSEPAGALEEAWQASVVHPAQSVESLGDAPGVSLTASEQESRDGQDVVALLSSSDHGDLGGFGIEPMSSSDMSNLRKALFGPGEDEDKNSSFSTAWDNALNFIPTYLGETAPGSDQELALHMGTWDRAEIWETWIGQWSRVLTEYQDEVWGDYGALVEQARAEVKQLQEKGTISAMEAPEAVAPALLRLRAILGHLRGGPSS